LEKEYGQKCTLAGIGNGKIRATTIPGLGGQNGKLMHFLVGEWLAEMMAMGIEIIN